MFAPTDEAFELFLLVLPETLLKPENKKLVNILTYHVLPGSNVNIAGKSLEVTIVAAELQK